MGTRTFTPPAAIVTETAIGSGSGDQPSTHPCSARRPAFVQQNYSTPQSAQSQVTVRYLNPQTAGNANILAIGWNDTAAAITAISDSVGNAYQAAVPTYRGNGLSQAIYYATNIIAGSNTLTVTFNQPAIYVDLRAAEYSGLNPTNAFHLGTSAVGNGPAPTADR